MNFLQFTGLTEQWNLIRRRPTLLAIILAAAVLLLLFGTQFHWLFSPRYSSYEDCMLSTMRGQNSNLRGLAERKCKADLNLPLYKEAHTFKFYYVSGSLLVDESDRWRATRADITMYDKDCDTLKAEGSWTGGKTGSVAIHDGSAEIPGGEAVKCITVSSWLAIRK